MISQQSRSIKSGAVPDLLKDGDVFLTKRNFLTALLASVLGAMLLFKSADLGEGIRKGLSICSYSVIPALFPFMALSVFICKSAAADFFGVILRPATRLLRIPEHCGGILLSAVIGGYPASAKNINDLVLEGALDRKTAGRMLCYCVNAGPPFLISAVGIGVFGSIGTGFLLFAAQFFSAVIIAVFVSVFSGEKKDSGIAKPFFRKSSAECAVESVISAAESCFRMCAFIVISFGVLEIAFAGAAFSAFAEKPWLKALFSGFFEVTSGCFACGETGGFSAIVMAGAIASFSGISVILQIAAVTSESGIPLFPFIVSRFFHAVLTAGTLRVFLAFFGGAVETFALKGGNYEAILSASAPAAVSLLCMTALFLLSVVPPKSEKEPLMLRIKRRFLQKDF